MKRLFAAIKINPSEVFFAHYYSLKKQLQHEKIKWVEPENLHLTLKFFGETPEHHIPVINVALSKAVEGFSSFEINIANTGIFGSSYKPRVIWLGIEDKEETLSLATKIISELEYIGIESDRQNFVPHLSLGRIRSLNDKNIFQKVIDQHKEAYIQKEEVKEIHLFESILRPQGPEYKIINSFELAGNSSN